MKTMSNKREKKNLYDEISSIIWLNKRLLSEGYVTKEDKCSRSEHLFIRKLFFQSHTYIEMNQFESIIQ